MLRGDPSDGLPGLRGVGAVAAAGLIHKHGDIAGVIRDASLNDTARDYLGRAMRVVTPMRALDIPLPAGRRDTYPANRGRLESLSSALGIVTAATRLVDALSARLAVGGS